VPPIAALEALIDDLEQHDHQFPGVQAENSLVEAFIQVYTQRSGRPARLEMSQRTFKLTEVTPPPYAVEGKMRLAELDDLPLMVSMVEAFYAEALPEDPRDHIQGAVRRTVERGMLFIWEVDGVPVSITSGIRPTETGISIGDVYTPPELRGRGYASALVASVSQYFLDAGKQYCTLFTNLANPTSNHIYQQIGYQAVADFSAYMFD
jgi:predicted GNAT family acetyltransferase